MPPTSFAPKDPSLALEHFTDKTSFTTGPVELSKVMNDDVVRIVDVRAREDFERQHVPNSINVPEDQWSNAEAHGLARDKTNVLLCYSQVCHLAARAAVVFAGKGFPVMELDGGFDGWKKHDLPTESNGDKPTDAVTRARELLSETRAAQANDQAKAVEPKPEPEATKTEAADSKPVEPKTKPEEGEGEAKADAKADADAEADADADAKADAKADADGQEPDAADEAKADDEDEHVASGRRTGARNAGRPQAG